MTRWSVVFSLVTLVGCATVREPIQEGEVRVARLRILGPASAEGVQLVFEGVEKEGSDIVIAEACVTWVEVVRTNGQDAELSEGPDCVEATETPSERTVSARVTPRSANLFTVRALLTYRYRSEPRESNVVSTSVHVP